MALIDTHTFIWFMYDDSKLSNNALSRIKSDKEVYVSIASLWEIAIKMSLGKIQVNNSIEEIANKCVEAGISILAIEPKHLNYISELPDIHKDPFDRLLISQAITEDLVLITKDAIIPQYDVETIW